MNCNEIIRVLEEQFPLSRAEEWDNPGLLAGRRDREVSTVLVALDAVDDVIAQAVECRADLLVTHHPLIFGSLKRINSDSFLGLRLLELIEHGISCYAMHTNYDVCAMADLNAESLGLCDARVLTYTAEEEGLGRVGTLPEPMDYDAFAAKVKEAFGLSDVRCYGESGAKVWTVAICGGSGKSLMDDVLASGADVFVTGDIDYHTGIDAWANGLRVIDAGHYGTEHCFMDDVTERLKKAFPDLNIIRADQKAPYHLV